MKFWKKGKWYRILAAVLTLLLTVALITGCGAGSDSASPAPSIQQTESGVEEELAEAGEEGEPAEDGAAEAEPEPSVTEDGSYNTKDEVALYIHTFGHLPDNYITKKEAEDLGWDSRKGNLDEVAPGKSIGGSHFGNYEKQLPEKKGRKYYECDIDFEGGYRGAERIIYSNDGLVFYTGDHYKTFEQLY